ncbi:MAG: pilus assembly protein [Anaerolineae bacterium]|nr:pilus assembly protein [Anaerolineae bacterium]
MRLLPFRPRHRRGQALVEFALILPLLILLVFGIIEMARVMQTLITLQNSARAAARYAAIGAIKWDIFDVTMDPAKPQDQNVLDGIVPCFTNDQRGTRDNSGSVQRYVGGAESLFATWYDGIDCDPREEDHQQMRRDILRIFSIIHEARVVSSGIGLGEPYNGYDWGAITPTMAESILYDIWTTPYPGNHEEAGYFYVDVCADRQFLNALSTGGSAEPTVANPTGNGFATRFLSLRNDLDANLAGGARPAYADSLPMCMHNENPPNSANPAASLLENTGHRWWDAGGPGERVVIFIRFNHPWITPINPSGDYITLQARRSSVNESFRAPKAVGAFQRSIPPGRDDENPPIEPPEETPPVQPPEPTIATPTPIPPTETPLPFDCNAIQLRWAPVPFSGNSMYVSIQNDNLDAILLTRVGLDWYASPSYPLMYARAFSLDNALHWQGGPPATTPQETIDTGTHGTVVAGTPIVGGQNTAIWTSVFLSGPPDMGSVFIIEDFEVEFRFEGPLNQNCNVLLVRPPRPTPTNTPIPTAGPSPTRTPDCATAQDISILGSNGVATIGYDTFDGSMYFTIVNSGSRPTYMTGFSFVWPSPTHPQIGRQAGDYYLTRVTVGGDGPADINTTLVWSAAGGRDQTGNTSTTAPYPPGTVSTSGEGTWQQNAVIPPGQTRVYFDFDGFPGSFPNAVPQLRNFHFNGTLFYVGCPTTGGPGGGGPGSVPTGVIGVQIPSPTTTNTPRPTNPPQPTNTNTPITPTQPRTPTATRTPTRTLTPSNTPLPPTRPPIGGLTPTAGGGGED